MAKSMDLRKITNMKKRKMMKKWGIREEDEDDEIEKLDYDNGWSDQSHSKGDEEDDVEERGDKKDRWV